jgi:hypothetical protein
LFLRLFVRGISGLLLALHYIHRIAFTSLCLRLHRIALVSWHTLSV